MDAGERRERASEEAAQWWLQLSSGDMARAEREQLIDWLRESPLHVAEMLHMAQVHGALESFEQWARIATEETDHDASVVPFPGEAAAVGSTADASSGTTHRRAWFLS